VNRYLRNCALCVLSHCVLSAGINDVFEPLCDQSVEIVEALLLAGATTVLYPLFGGADHRAAAAGAPKPPTLSALAHQLFLLKFYMELPAHEEHPCGVAAACRAAQVTTTRMHAITSAPLLFSRPPLWPLHGRIDVCSILPS